MNSFAALEIAVREVEDLVRKLEYENDELKSKVRHLELQIQSITYGSSHSPSAPVTSPPHPPYQTYQKRVLSPYPFFADPDDWGKPKKKPSSAVGTELKKSLKKLL